MIDRSPWYLCAALAMLAGCSSSTSEPASESASNTGDRGASQTVTGNQAGEPTEPAGPGGTTAATPAPTDDEARYRLTFDATWSPATHPTNFPGGPHFSGLVGAVHNEQVRLWEPGQIATPGMVLVAETGAKTLLLDEVDSAIASGYAIAAVDGGGVPRAPGSTTLEFDVSRDFPLVSIVTMLAPSPDWFAGVHGLSMLDDDGNFVTDLQRPLALYDAGSDSGTRYAAGNLPTSPPGIIERVLGEPQDSDFVNGQPDIGSFTIERLP